MQAEDPSLELLPAGHLTQASAPLAAANVPAGQALHDVASDWSANCPASQAVQAAVPDVAVYCPGTQLRHCSKNLAPRSIAEPQTLAAHDVYASGVCLPAGQLVQAGDPASEY